VKEHIMKLSARVKIFMRGWVAWPSSPPTVPFVQKKRRTVLESTKSVM